MQYKVPQDVQREDTIVGPLTLKQLIICGCGGGVAYAIYVTLAKTYFIEVWLPPVAIVTAITLALAFLRIYDLPFHIFMMDFIEYHLLPRKRFWVQQADNPFVSLFDKKQDEKVMETATKQKPTKSIKELSLVLDRPAEEELTSEKQEKHENLGKIINQNYKEK